ncbi:MAG TPA: class I SAM-dependent methyltransferase [Candidatus Paceibacterota bacterium]|nr:class I SAM-dependent methyltransferase [Candidatus Paceibacterota bacterium]
MSETMQQEYRQLWEDFAEGKSDNYLTYKFTPTHRVGLTNTLREEALIACAALGKNEVALDVGCAAGTQVFKMAKLAKEAYGVDIAQNFIDAADRYKATQNISNAYFACAPAEQLPYPDQHFDAVMCGEVLEHVFDADIALAEIKRVLKIGGRACISVPNLNADGTLWGRLLRLLGARRFVPMTAFSMAELAKHGDAHVREFSTSGMRAWLEKNGFRVESINTVSWIDGPSFDFLLKFPLHTRIGRAMLFGTERALSKTGLSLGRHMVVRAARIG